MTLEQERREALIKRLAPQWAGVAHNQDDGRWTAESALNDILAYFDEQEPAVANAIRFGLKEVGVQWICTPTCWQGNGPDGGHTEGCYPKPPDLRINYPEAKSE